MRIKKLTENTIRVIHIREDAIRELVHETFMESGLRFFDYRRSSDSVYDIRFDMDRQQLTCVLHHHDLYGSSFADFDRIAEFTGETTRSIFSPNPYVRLDDRSGELTRLEKLRQKPQKLKSNEIRVINIGSAAIQEFLYEIFRRNGEKYFDLLDISKVKLDTYLDFHKRELLSAVYAPGLSVNLRRDHDALAAAASETTYSLFSNTKAYSELEYVAGRYS